MSNHNSPTSKTLSERAKSGKYPLNFNKHHLKHCISYLSVVDYNPTGPHHPSNPPPKLFPAKTGTPKNALQPRCKYRVKRKIRSVCFIVSDMLVKSWTPKKSGAASTFADGNHSIPRRMSSDSGCLTKKTGSG